MIILHLEDDGPLREVLKISLMAADPTVHVQQFIDSDSALQYITENIDSIRLFVLDIRVPGELNGLEVATKIRELGSLRPIVMTSAYRKPSSDFLNGLQAIWLPKPWHILDAPDRLLPLAQN
ncbi:hypothetical protein MASR2M15_28430 [Anaerolineales bacterium]